MAFLHKLGLYDQQRATRRSLERALRKLSYDGKRLVKISF